MIDILAQMVERGPEYYGTMIGTALFILIGGGGAGALLHRKVTHRNDRINEERDERRDHEVCPLHDSTMQLLQERKDTADEDRRQIKDEIRTLSSNTKDNFSEVFKKLDSLNDYVRSHGAQ